MKIIKIRKKTLSNGSIKLVKTVVFLIKNRLSPFISFRYIHFRKFRYLDLSCGKLVKPKPNLIVLGAPRSGTTSLYNYLEKHPRIFMSSPLKEPCYYIPNITILQDRYRRAGYNYKNHAQLLKRCMLQGYLGQKFIGDASTLYTMSDFSRLYNIPQNMARANSNTKLIYLLRDPFERMKSHYRQMRGNQQTSLSFREFVDQDEFVVKNSMYFYQLEPYLDVFSREQFFITTMNELFADYENTTLELFQFLSLKPLPKNIQLKKLNKSKKPLPNDRYFLPMDKTLQLQKLFANETRRLNKAFGKEIKWDWM